MCIAFRRGWISGVGPEHAYWKDSKRAEYVSVTDAEALAAFEELARMEGILPALESAHALAHVAKMAPKLGKEKVVVVCCRDGGIRIARRWRG